MHKFASCLVFVLSTLFSSNAFGQEEPTSHNCASALAGIAQHCTYYDTAHAISDINGKKYFTLRITSNVTGTNDSWFTRKFRGEKTKIISLRNL